MHSCIICDTRQIKQFDYQGHHYFRCPNCKQVSTFPLPTSKSIQEHYKKKFIKGNYEQLKNNPEDYIQIYQDLANRLQKYMLKNKIKSIRNKKVLDIGCFTGDFLEILAKKGADVYGLELQADAVKIGNKKLPGKIFQADVMSYKFPQQQYDVITLLGLVEHVTNPQLLISRAYELIKPGGIIMIQTPNSYSLLARIMTKYWPPYSPIEHIHIFSKKSINFALIKAGFNTLEINNHWKNLKISYVYNNFSTFGSEFHKLLSPIGAILKRTKYILPFYIGEMVCFGIKKKN